MKGYIYNSKILSTLILIILICYSYQDRDNILNSENTIFPYSLTLLNGNILLVINDGIHFFDSNLENEETSKKKSFEEVLEEEDNNKVFLGQFSEEYKGYIMVFAKDLLYFFTNEGMFLDSKNISEYLNGNVFSLVPYKKENNNLYYIISYYYEFKLSINIFEFEINTPNAHTLKISKNFDITLENGQNTYHAGFIGPSCLFLSPASYEHDILVCFYEVGYPYELHSRSFDPNNDFEEIDEYFSLINDDNPPSVLYTITNNEKKKAFIFMKKSFCPYSLSFDFISFSTIIKIIGEEQCNIDDALYRSRLIYFRETNEFIFSGIKWGTSGTSLIRLDNNFNLIEYGFYKFPSYVYVFYTSCPFYNGEDYYLVYDNQNYILCGKIENITIIESGETQTQKTVETSNLETTILETSIIETTILETSVIETTILETTIIETTTIETTITTTIIETTLPSFTKNIKCKTATYESASYDLCTECDNDNGYYSAEYSDNSFLHGFLDCYKIDSKPSNLYYDNSLKIFKQCYTTCKTCSRGGNENTNYCLECEDSYIKQPDIPDSTNCVVSCSYMYYYTSYGKYKCTIEKKCPEEAKLYIEELNKCTDDCSKEEIYNYKYSGKCLKKCPENTEPNEDSICIDINLNECTKTESEFAEKVELDYDEIDSNAKIYSEDFSYTDKHVNHYYNNLYSILLYKDSYCIDELSLNMPKVDFGNCYSKVLENLDPPTNDNIIIALVEKFNKDKKSSTIYFFYHPITGKKIDASTICKNEEVVVKESVLSQLNNSNVDLESALFLAEQNIDIFNLSDAFYTDICFHFESPNGKDIPLKDRVKTFYPNVTLCDEGCEIKGVNLTTMESMCECKFSNLLSFGENALVQNALGGITDLLSSSNIMVFKCYKDLLQKKYFIKNTGGFIFLGIIFSEVIISIIFFFIDMFKVFKYLYKLTDHYINSLNTKNKNKNSKKGNNFLIINSIENEPPKKNEVQKYEEKKRPKKKYKKSKKNNFEIKTFDNNRNTLTTLQSDTHLKSEKNYKSKRSSKSRKNTSFEEIKSFDGAVKNISPNMPKKNLKKLDMNIDMEEYLKPDLDDMEYDDAIKYDNRSFCLFYWERLKEKQLIINTFCNDQFLRPLTMKLLLLLLNIDLYFVVNGLFYNEDYISDLFHSTEKETFFSFFTRSIERFFYATIVGVIVESIIGFIFIEEKKNKKNIY